MMIFYAAHREAKQYFWIAVIIRGLCTVPGSLKNYGTFKGEGLETVILLVYTLIIIAAAGFIAIKLHKNFDSEQILLPKELFTRRADKML